MSKLKDSILREKAEHSAFAEKELELAEELRDEQLKKERVVTEVNGRFYVDSVDVTAITKVVRSDFISVMGKVGRKNFHLYALVTDGKWSTLHGVTSVLKDTVVKHALVQWAADMACGYVKKALDTVRVQGLIDWDKVLADARLAHRRTKEDAGEKGHDVHSQIEEIVKKAIIENDGVIEIKHGQVFLDQVYLFVKWAVENKVRFIESEKPVVSRESHYAGTCDLVLEIDGKKYIGDVKTAKQIYGENYIQMAAYQGALEEMGEHTDIAGAMVINLPKKGGFEIGYNYDYAGNRMAFLAALVLYKQLNSLK